MYAGGLGVGIFRTASYAFIGFCWSRYRSIIQCVVMNVGLFCCKIVKHKIFTWFLCLMHKCENDCGMRMALGQRVDCVNYNDDNNKGVTV